MLVVVLGAWHLGAVAAVALADWGRDVEIWDRDPHVRGELTGGRTMVDEPGLAVGIRRGGARVARAAG